LANMISCRGGEQIVAEEKDMKYKIRNKNLKK
jgi:hypothetical protein